MRVVYKQLDEANAQILLLKQIANEQESKEKESNLILEEQITELKEKLERKEYFM